MLKSPLLFAIGVLVSLMSWTSIARASDDSLALNFSLPPTSHTIAAQQSNPALKDNVPITSVIATAAPIAPVSSTSSKGTKGDAAQPVQGTTDNAISTKDSLVEQRQPKNDIGLSFAATSLALPAEQHPTADHHQDAQIVSSNPSIKELISDTAGATALAFEPETVAYDSLGLDDWIFEGGSNSLVAHTVGSAEGTRQWNGTRTNAYYGHKDPGNGVWNLGTFSYQHAAQTPEEADKKQLRRLKNQGLELEQQATNMGLSLSLEEKLNGLDLANQAPIAALGKGGYIERLDQAYRMHMQGFEAISWARTRAYIDPDTQAWNAPGLGNNLHSISQDQERRMAAINKALRAYNRDDTTVRTLAKLDSISLESPSIENDDLSRWDIHLTSDSSRSTEDVLQRDSLQASTWSAPTAGRSESAPVDSKLAETHLEAIASTPTSQIENTDTSITSNRHAEKVPEPDTSSFTASLSVLSFGLPSSEATNTAPIEIPAEQLSSTEPQETEPLVSEQPKLERLLTSANLSTQPSLALQFSTTEEIALPDDDDEFLVHEDLTAVTPPQPENTTAAGLIATEPSTALAQLESDNVSPQTTISSKSEEHIENLQRFEDPISLGTVATPGNQRPPDELVGTTGDIDKALEENQSRLSNRLSNSRSRWRIRIEDRVIDRK